MKWKLKPIGKLESQWKIWDELNDRYFNSHPYYNSNFFSPLIKYFGSNSLLLAVLEDNRGDVTGMVLLKKRLPGVWSVFTPSQLQISPIMVADVNWVDCMTELLRSLGVMGLVFEATNQDPLYSVFREIENIPCRTVYHCTTTSVLLDGEFDTYFQNRPKKFKQNIRTAFNRLKKEGLNYQFHVSETAQEIKEGVKKYGFLESQSWKGKAGTAIHSDNIQGAFYTDMLINFADENNAMVYELYIKDEVVGSILAIGNKEMVILLKTTFSNKFQFFSPGRLVQYLFIEHEFKRKKYKVMEAYTNANKDQLDWSTHQRDIFHIEIYKNNFIKTLFQMKKGNDNLWML